MQKLRIVLCSLIALFGFIAAIFGVIAEVKRIKASQVLVLDHQCYYPNSPSLPLGLLAAISLLISQVISNASGGCICCCTNQRDKLSTGTRRIAVLCLVLSWVTFTNAFFLLVEGATLNGQQQYQGWVNTCYIVKPGVFGAGAVLAIFTAMLSITYYLVATVESSLSVGVGQPAISISQVVFVPEYSEPSYMQQALNLHDVNLLKAV